MPSNQSAEYQGLTLWVHNERREHNPNGGWAEIRREPRMYWQEQAYKLERPDGHVYFLFTRSSAVRESDLISWGGSSLAVPDEWIVTAVNPTNQCVRCEVERPKPSDRSIDHLLRAASFTKAAEYLSNARQRLDEGTATGWNDCVANCRNALQEVLTQLTGEKQLSEGINKLSEVCNLGEKETEYVKALEKLFRASRDVLSKSGAHPPMPGQPFAVFVLDITTATLRFLLTARK
jgi:hypothetical protein